MGVLDKLKNALFEVEYVEVEEPQKEKKEKKQSVFEKVKEKTEIRDRKEAKKEDKPIAKKIVLPGRKEEKIEELEEEELKDEDFEIRPKDETIKEEKDGFKFMDDADFEMDDYIPGEAEILNVVEEKEDRAYEEEIEDKKEKIKDYYREATSTKSKVTSPYGLDNDYSPPMHEYGTYERYEKKSYFRPSPIISPIYGILDKNYKKEDVKEKKEVRLSSYSRGNVSVDDIRNKAYGTREKEKEVEENIKFEVEEDEDNLAVDLSEETKPEVKEITVGDAEEYFEDLGLEYNVDYVDASTPKKEKKSSKKKEEEIEEKIKEEPVVEEEEEKVINIPEVEDEEIQEESDTEEDDNLFDLIDSMYQEDNKEGE